jgi:hypothetical protein
MTLHRIDASAEAVGHGAPAAALDHASGPGAHDPVEAYFECITTCSIDDGECVTSCTEILREHT